MPSLVVLMTKTLVFYLDFLKIKFAKLANNWQSCLNIWTLKITLREKKRTHRFFFGKSQFRAFLC
jgi:hypothetical protein